MKRTEREWLNYIAAFFDGEGCAVIKIFKCDKKRKCYKLSPSIKITQKKVAVLCEIKKILKFGKISKRLNIKQFNYEVKKYSDVLKFIVLIKPYSIVKRAQLSLLKKFILCKHKNRKSPRYTKEELKKMLNIRDELHQLNGGKIKYTTEFILNRLNRED